MTTQIRDGFVTASPLLNDAYSLAARAHRGQQEPADRGPYLRHPLEVAQMLDGAGLAEPVVTAGLLHDVVERSDVSLAEIRLRFGPEVARLVRAMTEPAEIESYDARKAAHRRQVLRAGPDAQAIFAADKLANASALRRAIERFGVDSVRRRVGGLLDSKLENYRAALELLARQHPAPPFLDSLEDELRRLGVAV